MIALMQLQLACASAGTSMGPAAGSLLPVQPMLADLPDLLHISMSAEQYHVHVL